MSRNSNYLSDVLLPVAMKKYDEISGGRSDLLSELSMQLRGPPKPKPRSVYKTDVIWTGPLRLVIIYTFVMSGCYRSFKFKISCSPHKRGWEWKWSTEKLKTEVSPEKVENEKEFEKNWTIKSSSKNWTFNFFKTPFYVQLLETPLDQQLFLRSVSVFHFFPAVVLIFLAPKEIL